MATTTREFFRSGKTPRLHHVRVPPHPDPEIAPCSRNGVDWVDARSGGASTFDAPLPQQASQGRPRRWWRLPVGTIYDDTVLTVENDYANHYSWMPAVDMPFKDFLAALEAVNVQFIRV